MNEFNCQLYISAQAKFNPVLARTSVQKVAKFATISYKELSEPALRGLLATFESIPTRLSI